MYWANFLHIYQPAEQHPDILEAVTNQSYRAILAGLKQNKKARLTLNVNAALIELFDKFNYRDVIDDLRQLGNMGQIEFTSSAKYHAFLPFLNDKEIIRQIQINDETNKFFLGEAYKPKGFFPPEMAYSDNLPPIIDSLGFEWLIVDEIAYNGDIEKVDYSKVYQIKNTKLKIFFRERRISNLIMGAVVRSKKTFLEATKTELAANRYVLTGMDGETFGHHRPGLEKFFFRLLKAKEIKLIKISEIPLHFKNIETVAPIKSSWASSRDDVEKNAQFLSWNDPDNIIHKWQNDFVNFAIEAVYRLKTSHPDYGTARSKLDRALASDQFFWASTRPWWSLEMIVSGAYYLLHVMRSIKDASKEDLDKAVDYYEKIISTAFEWQSSGKIREMALQRKSILRIPFKERTLESNGETIGDYYAFIEMMKKLEKKAVGHGEYEQAILWRDAIYKLKNKLDIYDTLNAVDLVRIKIPHEKIEKIIKKYRDKYGQIRGGQPEQRGE